MRSFNKFAATLLVMAAAIGIVGCNTAMHEHTFSEGWESNAESHWHKAACEHTEEVNESAPHNWNHEDCQYDSESGKDKRTCTVCGYEDEKDHVHGSAATWTKTATTHKETYDCCGAVKTVETAHDWNHEDCQYDSESGKDKRTCTACGYEDEKDHVHGSATTWVGTATKHWETYSCCGTAKSTEAAHVYKNGIVGTNLCIVCGYMELESVEVAGGTITGAAYSNKYTGVFPAGRDVTLSSFYIGKYEVTQAQYEEVITGQKVTVNGTEYALVVLPSFCTGSNFDFGIDWGKDHSNYPVENVTWYDAVYFCNALSVRGKLDPCYAITVTTVENGHITGATVEYDSTKNGYRLPTEAEWEYAARGGDPNQTDWNYNFSGADKDKDTGYESVTNSGLDNVGWYCYNNIKGETGDTDVTKGAEGRGTHEVGVKAANRLGIHDMSGNVFEWCWDWHEEKIGTGKVTDPVGAVSGPNRVRRGGSWYRSAYYSSVSYRYPDFPSERNSNVGFRVVRSCSK